MLYVIWYSKKRSRITGSYLVNTNTKQEARDLFKHVIDPGRERTINLTQTLQDVLKDYDESEEEFLGDIVSPELNGYVLIEAGT